MSIYDKILAQHEKGAQKSNESKTPISKEERFKRFFTTYLDDKVNEEVKIIRILPALEGQDTPFVETKGHSYQNSEGGYTKYFCPNFSNGEPCPFCEEKNRLYGTKNADDAKVAKKLLQRLMYSVRVVERGKESDGVKFWRFNKDSRGSGIYDKIVDVVKYLGPDVDIFDINEGFDLRISIKRDQNNKPTINSIMPNPRSSKLHEDENVVKELMADKSTWRDIYKVYPYEYLKIVLDGDTPVYVKEREKYVGKNALEAERETNKNPINNIVNDMIAKGKPVDYSTTTHINSDSFSDAIKTDGDGKEDDLPF